MSKVHTDLRRIGVWTYCVGHWNFFLSLLCNDTYHGRWEESNSKYL